MGWAVGEFEGRDIGYGVPAICDYPDCDLRIDRGLGYVCGFGVPYGGDEGCGLFFCIEHGGGSLCERCDSIFPDDVEPFTPKPDVAEWSRHKLTDPTWKPWRDENPQQVEQLTKEMAAQGDSQ